MKKNPNTKFMKVRCAKCKNEQTIFEKASIAVPCLVCGTIIAQPTGGKATITSRVLETLE